MKAGETRADIFEKIGGSGGYGGRSAKLQSRKSGANLAGNARHKVPREDITSGHGYSGKTREGGRSGTEASPKFIKKQKQKDIETEKRVKKEKVKEKISNMVKRAKRDKELESKIGKKGMEDAKKAYKGLYGSWLKREGFSE